MLHSEEIDLLTLPPKNLGLKLVECALESNRVSELKIAIQKLGPSSNLDVLKTQIAIAEKDFVIAKDLLRKLFEEIQASNSKDFLFTVCQVAIPAFRVEELRASALPILKTLLERERERNNLTEAEFNALPLVVEIDATIGSQSLPQR